MKFERWPVIGYPLIIVLLAGFLYSNTLRNDFAYDDFREVTDNPLIRAFHLRGLFRTYFKQPGGLPPPARPVPLLTYAVNYALGGLHPFGYHLVNVLLHGAISLLIYRVGLQLFPLRRSLAFITAAFFAAHPIHADVVAPVAGRSELLATFCQLTALWIYLKRTPFESSGWSAGYWLTLPLFIIGALSKETAFALPFLAMGIDLYRFKARKGKMDRSYLPVFIHRLKKFYLPYLLIVAMILAITFAFGYRPREEQAEANFLFYLPPFQRIAAALGILMRYLTLLAFPGRLCCDYGFAQLSSPSPLIQSLWTAGGTAAAIAALTVACASFRRHGRYFLAVFIFAAAYGIVSNLLVVINTPMAERLVYLPSWGFYLLVGLVLEDAFGTSDRRKSRSRFFWPAVIFIVTAYSIRTWIRNGDWKDQFNLMSAAYRVSPKSARVNYNLGLEYEQKGNWDRAIFHYETAAGIIPGHPLFHLNLGTAYAQTGERAKAAGEFQEVIRILPRDVRGYFNLGRVYCEMGLWNQAAGALIQAEKIEPGNWRIHYQLGNVNLGRKDFRAAIANYQRAVFYRPDLREAYNNLGVACLRIGEREKAIEAFRKALALDPDYEDARRHLAAVAEAE